MTESLNSIHNNRVDIMNLLVDQAATSGNLSETEKITKSASFSRFFSEACDACVDVQDMFQAAFPGNGVQTKVGCCDVPWSSWDRNDFPIWEYFKRNTTADCLNNWRPTGQELPQWDSGVQKGLSQIDQGEMVLLMPKKLWEKMESDPEFAETVLDKVQKWKEDYDRADNAIAASLGCDPYLNQASKSYCIRLDEDGNVGYHTVVGGGPDEKRSDSTAVIIIDSEDYIPVRRAVTKEAQKVSSEEVLTESDHIDYEHVAPILMGHQLRKPLYS